MKKGETKSNRTTKGGKINYERLIRQTAELEQAAGNLLIQIDKNKKKLQKHFDEKGLKEMVVDAVDGVDGVKLVCKKQERCTIKYNVESLKERFDDDLFIEMTKRSYKINYGRQSLPCFVFLTVPEKNKKGIYILKICVII